MLYICFEMEQGDPVDTLLPFLAGRSIAILMKRDAKRPSSYWVMPCKLVVAYLALVVLFYLIYPASAMDHATNKDWEKLPGVQKWDGVPSPYFRLSSGWFQTLKLALGGIYQDGDTLLRCCQRLDAGHEGVVGAAGGGLPTQEEVAKNRMRRQRAAACIVGRLPVGSAIYRLFMTTNAFMNDGPAQYHYLFHVGHRDFTSDERKELVAEWNALTMASAKIPFDAPNALQLWYEALALKAEPLQRTIVQQRTKFYEGLPTSFTPYFVSEQMLPDPGSFSIGAVFPPHHPNAGAPNPANGSPDLPAMVAFFQIAWDKAVKNGIIRRVPRGSVYAADCDEDDVPPEAVNAISKSRINGSFICLVCGGFGHAGNVDGTPCLTAQLGIKVPNEQLQGIKYPKDIRSPFGGGKKPFPPPRKPHGANAAESDADSESSGSEAAQVVDREKRRDSRRRPSPRRNGKQPFRPRDKSAKRFAPKRPSSTPHGASSADSSDTRAREEPEQESEGDDAESSLAATLYSVEFDEIVIAAGGTPLGGAVSSDEQ